MNRKISVIITVLLLSAGCIAGLMLPLRPKISEIEQRELTAFPKYSTVSMLNGVYLSDISTWYADSYPAREEMLEADRMVKSCYGLTTKVMMVGNAMDADEIPDEIPDISDEELQEETCELSEVNAGAGKALEEACNQHENANKGAVAASITEDTASGKGQAANSASDNAISENAVATASENAAGEKLASVSDNRSKDVEPPVATAMDAEIKKHLQQSLYVKNGAAYSVYYFNKDSAARYIKAMNGAANKLDGICDVYSLLIPNQSGAMLPLDELKGLGGSDQIGAIHYYYSQYDNVKTVDTIDTLREHSDEYLYFRTDHHWTSLGAYYVYRNFCKEKGIVPHELDYYEKKTFEPFLGSFYSELKNPDMENNPDYVDAYIPHGTNDLVYWDPAGNRIEWNVIKDVSGWNKYSKYCCFIAGDKPLTIIENPEISDGSACLVIKESYGNCFVPFLVDHYQTVYIMDYRYATKNAIQFIKDNNINDLIMINNITIAGSGKVIGQIEKLLD